jgi:hypothetical protein
MEENVRPNTPEDMDRVILEHIGPIVKFLKLKSWLDIWHFLRESQNWRNQEELIPHIRFRVKARSEADLEKIRDFVRRALDGLQQAGKISDHYRGNHGNLSQDYMGESGGFDETSTRAIAGIRSIPQGWSAIQIWLQAGSEIELVFLKNRFQGVRLGQRFMLRDILHFFANQCNRDHVVSRIPQGECMIFQL